MHTIINLLLIQFIIVNIIDISGFIQEMESRLSKWLGVRCKIPKPFSCSYCLTFWVGLTYLLCTGITLSYTAVLMILCALTTTTGDIIYLVKDILTKIIITINRVIQ